MSASRTRNRGWIAVAWHRARRVYRRAWRKSSEARRTTEKKNDKGFFQVGTTEALHHRTTQTIFLESIESPVLFAASRPIAIQGDFH